MAQVFNITNGLQNVSATGAVPGTLDISALGGDCTIKLRVASLGAGRTAVIALEDTVNNFTATLTQAVFQVSGQITPDADKVFSINKYELPAFRNGVTNGACRINVLSVSSSPGLSLHAWLER